MKLNIMGNYNITDTAVQTIIPRNMKVSISAKATNVFPYSLSPSSGFLEDAILKKPNSIPLPSAPKAIGIIVKPNSRTFAHLTRMMPVRARLTIFREGFN